MLIDPTGVYVRPEGHPRNKLFICGLSPPSTSDPTGHSVTELVTGGAEEEQRFETDIWPVLAARVGAFEGLRRKGTGWNGFYDYNTFDQVIPP